MSTFATPQPIAVLPGFNFRSTGAKFFLLLVLALVMSIPGFFVDSLAESRANQHGIATSPAAETTHKEPTTFLGVRLADSYRSTQRSLKYITLFLGLVFLTYFVFEVTNGKRVHPGQYALVGIAQTVFYLLLLSLAERIGFDFAFLAASAATVALFAINTNWIFRSRRLGLRAFAVFSSLYAFIYVLLRLQQYALLVGAFTSFAAVSATMYFTRNVDWYSSSAPLTSPSAAGATAPATPGRGDSWLD